MIQIEELDTVVTVDGTLPTLQRSEDARAFASFPNFTSCIHPNYLFNDNNNALDRANGSLTTNGTGNPIPDPVTFPNGAPALDLWTMKSNAGGYAQPASPVNISEFSYACVINLTRTGDTPGGPVDILRDTQITGNVLRILIRPNYQFGVYNGSTIHTLGRFLQSDEVNVILTTYSPENGAKIFNNGVLIASNSAPLVLDSNSFAARRGVPATSLVGYSKLLTGADYLMSIDLSKPEHADKRAAMTNYLINTYIN